MLVDRMKRLAPTNVSKAHHTWIFIVLIVAVCLPSVPVSAQEVVEGFEGGAVTLPCTVTITGDLRWFAVNNLILLKPASGTAQPSTGRWHDAVSLEPGTKNLVINPLSRDRDDGKMFRCDVTGGGGPQDTTVRVLARITRVSISPVSQGQVTVTEGTPKPVTCTAHGDGTPPNPTPAYYSWSVDDVIIPGQTGSSYDLTANKTMRTVRCTATNLYTNGSVLTTVDGTATLKVQYLDSPTATSPITVTENNRATLRCSSEGNPPPTYEWKRSGSSEVKASSADYTIEDVPRSAAGEYTCDVSNSIRSRQTSVTLIVQYPPEVSVTYEESSRTLTCTAQGVPDLYTFSHWEHRLGGISLRSLGTPTNGTSVKHQFPHTLTFEDTGEYMCTATNGVKSPQTGQTYIAPLTAAVFQNQSNVLTLGLGRTASISVPFYTRSPSGDFRVTWTKSGQTPALASHEEQTGPVSLVIRGQTVSIQGNVTTLTLTNVSSVDEGTYSVTVTSGTTETSTTSFYVNVTVMPVGPATPEPTPGRAGPVTSEQTPGGATTVTPMPGAADPPAGQTQTAAIAGGAAGAVFLIIVIIIIVVIVVRWRRSRGTGGAGGKEEKTSVNEHLFSSERWKQPDAEVAENDLYEPASFSKPLPPQEKRPPKPARTFEHNSVSEPPTGDDKAQEMEMVENSLYVSADVKGQAQKNGAAKAKKGKPVKGPKPGKTQLPIDDDFELGTDFNKAASGANNNNPPPVAKRGLKYEEVQFDNKRKKPKPLPQPGTPTEYADIRFTPPKP